MAGQGGQAPDEHPAWRRTFALFLLFVLSVLGYVLVALGSPPETALNWVLLVMGAVLSTTAAAAWALGVLLRLLTVVGGRLRAVIAWIARPRVLVPVAATLALLWILGPLGLDAFRAGYIEVAGCAPPPELRVVTAPDNLDTARAVGERYEAATAARDHGCPEAAVSVFPLDSRIVASHAASPTGWWDPVAGLTELGPQPDLWLTSTWAEMAPEVRTGTALAEAAPRLVATTPVVVGLPSTSPIGTSQLNSMPWAADFQSLVGAGELVARPDPETPGTGPVATTLLYGQGDPASPARVERALAGGRPQGGIPAGDSVAQICAYRRSITPGGSPTGSPQARTAVITTEQEISRLDRGDPLGTSCPAAVSGGLTQDTRLVAAYPRDTRVLDYHVVRLDWQDSAQAPAPVSTTSAQDSAASEFEDWLGSAAGRDALATQGLRPPGDFTVPPGSLLDQQYGVNPDVAVDETPVSPDVLAATQGSYQAAQPHGRVLLAIDTSGSMNAPASSGVRLDAVRTAVDDSLHLAGPKQDDVGLWVFPGAVPGGHQELVPIAQAQPGQVAAVSQSLTRVVPNGGTPLYRTMVDSAASVGPGDSATTSAAVIITDGEDTSSGLTPQSTAAQLPAGTRLIVLTLGEVRCNGPGLSALTTASSRVECVDADTDAAGLSARLDAVLDDIWSGR